VPVTEVRKHLLTLGESAIKAADERVPVKGRHVRLAAMRHQIERHLMQYLYSVHDYVTDIGGSLKRNRAYGDRLHICLPNETPADNERMRSAGPSPNDIGQHKYEDCPKLGHAALSIFSANHLSIDELAKMGSRRLGLVVEHIFTPGEHTISFDGVEEATVSVDSGSVTMTTHGGTVYHHPYYHWRSQGIIVGTKDACYYRRVYHSPEYMLGIFMLYPLRGSVAETREFPTLRRSITNVIDDLIVSNPTHSFSVSLVDSQYHLIDGDDRISFPQNAVDSALMRTVHLPVDTNYPGAVTASCQAALSRHEIKSHQLEFELLILELDKQHRSYHNNTPLDTAIIDRVSKISTLAAKSLAPVLSRTPRYLLSKVQALRRPEKRNIEVKFMQTPTATFVAEPGPRSAQIALTGPTPFPEGAASDGGHQSADHNPRVISHAVPRERAPFPKHARAGPQNPALRPMARRDQRQQPNHSKVVPATSRNGSWRAPAPLPIDGGRTNAPLPGPQQAIGADNNVRPELHQDAQEVPPQPTPPAPVRGVGEEVPAGQTERHETSAPGVPINGAPAPIVKVLSQDGVDVVVHRSA